MTALLRVLYPERVICVLCARPSHGEMLCGHCRKELDALRLEDGRHRASYLYDGPARALIHRLKYQNVTAAATVLARAMAWDAMQMHLAPDTVITWVTMPGKRKLERGIDHGQVLARALGLRLNLPVRRLLVRSGEKPFRTQRGAGRAERLRNVQGLFSAEENLPRHVLLVDDVYTTGATVETCCACLRRGGAKVMFLTAAKVI